MSRSAARLQIIRDDWDMQYNDLAPALSYNRRLWNIFLLSVTKDDHPLPAAIRQNIANLGIFVANHTNEIMRLPLPEKLTVLITINRELAAGLRQSAR